MKCLVPLILFAILLCPLACTMPGASTSTDTANQDNSLHPADPPPPPRMAGTWTAVLTNTATQQQATFSFTLTQNGSALTGSNIVSPVSSPCFGTGTSMTGTAFIPSGSTQAGVRLDMWSQPDQSGNHLQMSLTPNSDQSATGTYTLSPGAPDCSAESGTASLTRQQ